MEVYGRQKWCLLITASKVAWIGGLSNDSQFYISACLNHVTLIDNKYHYISILEVYMSCKVVFIYLPTIEFFFILTNLIDITCVYYTSGLPGQSQQ